MKDGCYLSAYISINALGNMYQFMGNRHDMSIALWNKEGDNVKLEKYWELERFTGLKHHELPIYDNDEALELIENLLSKENIKMSQINEIWGCPKLDSSGYYKLEEYYFHSISHLYSSLLSDTDIFYNDKIIGFALDLRADNETEERQEDGFHEYLGCYSNKGEMTYFEIASPAVLWCVCKAELSMQEGSLMALATATDCKFKNSIEFDETIDFTYPNYETAYKIYNKIFSDISIDKLEGYNPDFNEEENFISAGMKEVNRLTLELMSSEVKKVLDRFDLDSHDVYLSFSGGFGLNCPTNAYLINQFGFKGFLGVPCMDDSGQALGIGLFNFYMGNNKKINFKLEHAFYGAKNTNIDDGIEFYRQRGYIEKESSFDPEVFVNDLENDVIVWVDSNAEIGPRALGHRSLLGDPRKTETKDRLNQVKQRQFWRPVAPIVLREHVAEWFEDDVDSPYMLMIDIVKEEKRDLVPAILHYDNTARIQTIEKLDETACLYDALKLFYEKTGVPIVCNTSLNDKGQPIINSAYNAICFALKKKIKVVYVNQHRIELKLSEVNSEEVPTVYDYDLKLSPEELDRQIKLQNPFNIERRYLIWKDMFKYDITTERGVKLLKRSVDMSYKNNPDMERMFRLF